MSNPFRRVRVPSTSLPPSVRGLADAAIVARVNGQLYDLTRPFEADASLEILTAKNPEALKVYRHSTAHLLAAAVLELFPGTNSASVRPSKPASITISTAPSRSLRTISKSSERRMWEMQAQDLPFERVLTDKEEGLRKYREAGETMKCELIEEKADASLHRIHARARSSSISAAARTCRPRPSSRRSSCSPSPAPIGRATSTTSSCSASTAPRSSPRRSWTSTSRKLEEAKKRDHRKLGKELDLFSIQELAGPGLIFFHPKGGIIRKQFEDWMRDQYLKRGYSLVYTPHVARSDLWKTSGHYNFYAQQHVHAHGAGRRRISAQAHELPVPHPDLCRPACTAIASCRCAWASWARSIAMSAPASCTACCACAALRRTTRTSSALRTRSKTKWSNCLQFAIDTLNTFGFTRYEAELSTWDGGASGKYDGTPRAMGTGRKRAAQSHRAAEPERHSHAGRSGFLRPQDRREAGRRHRPQVAAFHRAVRFHAAAPLRSGIHRARMANRTSR